MRAAAVCFLMLVVSTGCNRAERRSLKEFLEAVAASLGHPYDDQLRDLPGPERRVRFRVLFARDQLAAVDRYLGSQPPLGADARAAVEGFRAAKADELELFERLAAERRFELTKAESRRDAELRTDADRNLEKIGRLIDG